MVHLYFWTEYKYKRSWLFLCCTHKYMNAVCVDDTHKYSAHQACPESSVHEWVWHGHDAWAQAAFDDMEQSTDWSI